MSKPTNLLPEFETLVAAKDWDALEQLLESMDDRPIADPGFPERRPLPEGKMCEGRQVWEPPEIDCSDLIGEEYEKLREAVLDFTAGDKAKTTEFLDWEIESTLNCRYQIWAGRKWLELMKCGNKEGAYFFQGLWRELMYDASIWYDKGYERMGVIVGGPNSQGEFRMEIHDPDAPMWGGDPRYKRLMEEQEAARKAPCVAVEAGEGLEWSEGASQSARGRGVAQDGDEEAEKVEWFDSLEMDAKQPVSLKPVILQMVESCVTMQRCVRLTDVGSTGDEVD